MTWKTHRGLKGWCSGLTGGCLKEDSSTPHFPWQLLWHKISKDKVKAQCADINPSGRGGVIEAVRNESVKQTDFTSQRDHNAKEEDYSCKTFDRSPSTRPPQHSATQLVLIHRLAYLAALGFRAHLHPLQSRSLPSSVTSSSRRSRRCASGAWNCSGTSQLSAVSFARNLHYVCPSPCLHVNSQGRWAPRSQPWILMKPQPHPVSGYQLPLFYFHHSLNTLHAKFLIARFHLLSGFRHRFSQSCGWVDTLSDSIHNCVSRRAVYTGSAYLASLNVCCQRILTHMLKEPADAQHYGCNSFGEMKGGEEQCKLICVSQTSRRKWRIEQIMLH